MPRLRECDAYLDGFRAGLKPEPRLTLSEWCAEHVRVESGGRLDLDMTPYLREPLDALSPRHPAHRVIGMFGSQLGKTTMGLAWTIVIMAKYPAPTLMLRSSIDDARDFCRERLDPIIAATPLLRGVVREARSKEGGNTLTRKEFAGGFVTLAGAKSPRGLKSRPIRFIFADEIDDYPGDVKEQGDPIVLAEKRCQGPFYQRRKIFLIGTPTVKGISRIEREWLKSDRRRFFVPCPECGEMDFMTWSGKDLLGGLEGEHNRITWDEGKPDTARMVCASCGSLIEERHKEDMLARGEWRPTARPEDRETIGFHLSSLYSPWRPWRSIVQEWLETKGRMLERKGWVNSVLAESWEEPGDAIDPSSLAARLEEYPAAVPSGVGILVAAVDVHPNRLECAVKGYGAGEESWLIAFSQFMGDPGQKDVWFELDQFLGQTFDHESGQQVPISCVTIDAGDGHFAEQVYRFCSARRGRRIFPIKGGSEVGKPLVGRPSLRNVYRTPLYVLCTDTGKEAVVSRLRIAREDATGQTPGYCHLPNWVDAEYLQQLTAEKAVRKWVKTRGLVREWVQVRERNEAFDLEVYCLAALYIVLGRNGVRTLGARAAALSRKAPKPTARKEAEPAQPLPSRPTRVPRMPGKGWIHGWRG